MATSIGNRIEQTSTTTGTGTFTLAAVALNRVAFSTLSNGTLVPYVAENVTGTEWENGIGTVVTGTPDTFQRTTVITSSNGGSAVNFSAGTKTIRCSIPASLSVWTDSSGTIKGNLVAMTLTGALVALTVNGNTFTTGTGVLTIAAAKTLTALKSISFTAADDTGVYTLPTGTKTLVATDVTTLSSLVSIGTITTGAWNAGAITSSGAISSTLTTDATSATTGSIITAGGISMQKALWVGTTSRHVGATQFDAAITYGGVTLSNAVTGTGNMVLSASPTLTGTLTAAAGTFSSTFGATGAATFGSTIASGAITSTGAVTGTYFTATAAATNGLGLVAANTPALYASTTEFMRSTTALTTLNLPTTLRYDSASGLEFKFQNQTDGTASYTGMRWGVGGSATNAGGVFGYAASFTTLNNQRAAGMEFFSNGAGGTVISALNATGDVFIYNRGTLACTFGASQAATFAANISATYFTPTATGNNGLGLAAAGTPAIYVNGTTEAARFDTSGRLQLSNALIYGGITLSNAVTGTGNMVLSASPTLTGTLTAATITASGAVTGTAFIPSSATVPANGLYLTAANTIALAANTTEVMRSTSALTTLQLATTVAGLLSVNAGRVMVTTDATAYKGTVGLFPQIQMGGSSSAAGRVTIGTQTNAGVINIIVNGYLDSGTAKYNNGTERAEQLYIDSSGLVYASAAAGTVDTAITFTNHLTIGSTGAATFASSVTATYFTPTATGTNGLGLAAANTPALYASTTEVLRSTTSLLKAQVNTQIGTSGAVSFAVGTTAPAIASYPHVFFGVGSMQADTGSAASYGANYYYDGSFRRRTANASSRIALGQDAAGDFVAETAVTGAADGVLTWTRLLGITPAGAATFGSTIASGAITSTGAVTGTTTVNVTGTNPSFVAKGDNNTQPAFKWANASGTAHWQAYQTLSGSSQGNWTLYNNILVQNTMVVTAATNAVAFASNVTATYFTPTATGNNGLGLAAANTPAFYASTTEVLRATTSLMTAAVNVKAPQFYSTITTGTSCTGGVAVIIPGGSGGVSGVYIVSVTSSADEGGTFLVTRSWNGAAAQILTVGSRNCTFAVAGGDITATFTTTGTFTTTQTRFQ